MAKTASAVEEEISRDCLNRLGHAGYMLDAAQGSVCIAERRYKKGASCESSISSQTSVLWACGDALLSRVCRIRAPTRHAWTFS